MTCSNAPPPADKSRLGAAFVAAFRRRAPTLDIRPQRDDDGPFLAALFIACSPLAGILPPPLLEQQARLQRNAHQATYPGAMGSIVLHDSEPVGRIALDWRETASHCVDVAVLPDRRGTRAGSAMLRAWLDVLDVELVTGTLMVARDNPAAATYASLGFVPAAHDDPRSLHAHLRRVPVPTR